MTYIKTTEDGVTYLRERNPREHLKNFKLGTNGRQVYDEFERDAIANRRILINPKDCPEKESYEAGDFKPVWARYHNSLVLTGWRELTEEPDSEYKEKYKCELVLKYIGIGKEENGEETVDQAAAIEFPFITNDNEVGKYITSSQRFGFLKSANWQKERTYTTAEVESLLCLLKERLADEAKMLFHDGTTKKNKPLKYFQSGADNLQVDRNSILNLDHKSVM